MNYDQLPKELLAQLSRRNGPTAKKLEEKDRVKTLLQDKGPMSKDELLIAYWEDTKTILTRTKLSTLLTALMNAGEARRAGYGVYALKTPPQTGSEADAGDHNPQPHTAH